MDTTTARAILSNLRERIETDENNRHRLVGVITEREIEALDLLIAVSQEESAGTDPRVENLGLVEHVETNNEKPTLADNPNAEVDATDEVSLDLTALELTEGDGSFRVCLDFGTAMSKATFIRNDVDNDFEEIHVLRLGVPGDQEEVDEVMLISSLYVDADGVIWFGKKAIDRARAGEESGTRRLDNIKRWLSEGNLDTPVDANHNPTGHEISYEDLVLAYLAFFTWAVNEALVQDVSEIDVPKNFQRRFAMPCFPRPNAEQVKVRLTKLLGEAQVIADTFGHQIHEGLPLRSFLSAVNQLRAGKHVYPFIEQSITEPLGVAGSLLSWRAPYDALALVIDVGAGTSDFSLYRLLVAVDENGEIDDSKTTALEVEGSARGITEAGNHLDNILKGFILNQAGITSEHPQFINIAYDLERQIRDSKETLFNTGSVFVVLYSGESVDVSLGDFLADDAVKAFQASLKSTLIDVLESVNQEFITWVRMNPSRNLIIVLTGGGASLPMVKGLASANLTVNGSPLSVAASLPFPAWLQQDYPDLEDHYSRIAVSLGGARMHLIQSKGVATTTGSGQGGYVLERFQTRGS
ncbi:MAG TPA: hypothetical protein PLX09_02660 [Xanthomonadaceae bacterium]|nr:hypothetical protein [Xanthomonadaceae bacterium]